VGLVAVLLVAVATTWGGVLVLVRGWLADHVLAEGRTANVVATLNAGADGASLQQALRAAFPQATALLLPPAAVQQQLASWFPELAPVLAGLPEGSFPPLLQAEVPAAGEAEVARWLAGRPEVGLVQSSRAWQQRLAEVTGRLAVAGTAAAAVLLAGCVAVVLLVVRLLVLDHADEIGIMRLIGAHEGAIRAPYLACGVSFGVAGGALGSVLLAAMWAVVRSLLPGLPLAPVALLALPLAGALLGLVGAAIGLLSLPREP